MPKTKATYVDGFVLVVPKKKLAAYKKMAQLGCKAWMKHGAIDYKECVLDDNDVQCGMPFTKLTNIKKDEVAFFSYITYKSKAHRNQVNKKVMKEMQELYPDGSEKDMPFDVKKMSYGGFKVLVNSEK